MRRHLPSRELTILAAALALGLSSACSPAGAPAARYGEVIPAAEAEFDVDRLVKLIEEAETILADNAVLYPLVRRQGSYRVYWPDRIEGLEPNRIQGWDTWNAAWWKTP